MSEGFGIEFFDEGKEIPSGGYYAYILDNHYPKFIRLANWIKNSFHPQRVLDVGCAKGFLVKAFNDSGIEAWGVDASEYAIRSSPADVRSSLYKVDLNKDAFPFEDGSVDFVTFVGTIEYLAGHGQVIREIRRVLRQGGWLYLATVTWKSEGDRLRLNKHGRGYWIKAFRSNGFRIASRETSTYLKEECLPLYLARDQGSSLKKKVGRLLYQNGGQMGRQTAFLVAKYIGTGYTTLFFVRG